MLRYVAAVQSQGLNPSRVAVVMTVVVMVVMVVMLAALLLR